MHLLCFGVKSFVQLLSGVDGEEICGEFIDTPLSVLLTLNSRSKRRTNLTMTKSKQKNKYEQNKQRCLSRLIKRTLTFVFVPRDLAFRFTYNLEFYSKDLVFLV